MKKRNLPALGFGLALLLVLVVAASIDYRALNTSQFTSANTVSIINGARMTNTVFVGRTTNAQIGFSGDVSIYTRLNTLIFWTYELDGEVAISLPNGPGHSVLYANTNGVTYLYSDSNNVSTVNIYANPSNTVIHKPLGDGAALTNLNASELRSGTVPTARLGSGTANSGTILYGDSTWGAAPTGGGGPTNNLVFSRWESQTATSDSTNYVISVTNNLGRFMAHHIQIAATGNVMLHPVCETNAVLSLTITTDSTRNILWPTNFALFNATGVTLANTNWVLPVPAGTLFTASISTNVALGRRVMYWRVNVW
ncbi:MAG TPA: hypothetical protein VFU31_22700 [Candidatus Binatia bacterium]|nr:hypothetical protein [Candidatus Binatia bacterium]